jgi:hypothetical protein
MGMVAIILSLVQSSKTRGGIIETLWNIGSIPIRNFTITALGLWSGADFETQNLKICTKDY